MLSKQLALSEVFWNKSMTFAAIDDLSQDCQ